MQGVFRLIVGDRLWTVQHVVGDFLTAVRRKTVHHHGAGLRAAEQCGETYVLGRLGQRYALRITNESPRRIEVVASVDGRDVLDGETADYRSDRGYVIAPWGSVTIDGWRLSQGEAAAFRFARVADSYAARTGSARDVGVIGVAFFGERGDSFVPENELRMRDTASPFPADPRFAQPPRR